MKTITIKNNPIIIKNDNFQTIQIHAIYPYQEEIKDLAKEILIPQMLMYMTEQYPTEGEFQKALKENYILSYFANQITIGTTACINFKLVIPDEQSLKQDVIEKQIQLFSNAIYHPKTVNQYFDSFEVNREKENLKLRMNSQEKSFKPYLNYTIAKLIDTGGIFSRDLKAHKELIEEITPKNLFEYYEQRIINNTPIIFIMGNIKKEKINPIIKKYFPIKENLTLTTDYIHYLKPNKEKPQEIVEEKEFKDSALSFIYKVKNMQKEDSIMLGLIQSLLSSQSSRLLSKKLRHENNLIYSSAVNYYPNYGLLKITAYINPKNKDITQEKIVEVMENLKDKEMITPLIEKIKNRRRIDLIRSLDNKYDILNDKINKILGIDDTEQERYEKLKEKTAEDVYNFMDKLQLDTIYFLKEKSHE